ncbi:microviridin/marinostatin family tricyclic proteinase inhibitor [Chryseobacterium sp. JK1]|uniref:microviridin/marinostatin family tricyclic proteinase inhibitor n=1 Tax=Chryseobacterium sp. JK1 TaxID=874294 RepID=UPI003D697E66
MENKKTTKKPFFATFLEKQIKDPETVKGGGTVTSVIKDHIITTALEDTVVTTQLSDHVNVTLKYPSDGDDDVLDV